MIYGKETLDSLADQLMQIILRTAAGELTVGEALGHRDGVINQEEQFDCGGKSMNELVFRGYLRPNGQAGVRNIVLVLHTVNCSRHVAAKICAQARGRESQRS